MRKKFVIFQASPRRLLSLLLIQIIIALAVPYVDGTAESDSGLIKVSTLNSIKDQVTGGPVLIKSNQLISRCSQRYVQMKTGRKIDGLGGRRSPYSQLEFESVPTERTGGIVKIKGHAVSQYLCFSRRGRLIYRNHGGNSKCQFREVTTHDGYLQYQSVAKPEWYVGFNRRGKRMKGYSRRRQKCLMFTKLEWNEGSNKVRHWSKANDYKAVELKNAHVRNR